MLPHPRGEDEAWAEALGHCIEFLHELDVERDVTHEGPHEAIGTIRQAADTTGLEDPTGRGTIYVRIEQLTEADREELATAIDDVAAWFEEAYHGARHA